MNKQSSNSPYFPIVLSDLFFKPLKPCRKSKSTVKTCIKWPLSKRQKIVFQDQLSLIAGQKYCRMLQGEHSATLSTFIKLRFVIKIFVLSIFEWPFYTGFIVHLRDITFLGGNMN